MIEIVERSVFRLKMLIFRFYTLVGVFSPITKPKLLGMI